MPISDCHIHSCNNVLHDTDKVLISRREMSADKLSSLQFK